jgi:cytochrome c biogenesis protein CcmG, thiol:disulfide interchange protein DsbE
LLAFASVVALLSLVVWKVAHDASGASLVAAIERGDRPAAPDFALPVIWNRPELWPLRAQPALADNRVSLAELRGTPVVLNFWASWCIPCKDEAPHFAAAARSYRREIAFLGLDIQDFTADARGFLEDLDVPYPSIRDGSPDSFVAYGLTGVPETYYIDREGRIAAHSPGAISRAELERKLAVLLGIGT